MSNTRSQKFLYNTIISAVQQIFIMFVGFIIPRVMLMYFGSEINGVVSSISQFITYFSLVEAGIGSAAVFSLYKPLADNDYKAINKIISATDKFYKKAGYFFICLVLIFAFIYPSYVKISGLSQLKVFTLVLIISSDLIINFFTLGKYRALLTADQCLYYISSVLIIQQLINTILVVIFAKNGFSIIVVRGVSLFSIIVRSLILLVICKRKYPYLNVKEKPNYKALDKRWNALYLQILGSIQRGAPIILATFFTNFKEVSVYTIYNIVMVGVNNILNIFMSGLSSGFGDIIARKDTTTLKKAYSDFEFAYIAFITIIYSVTLLLFVPFILIYTKGITDADYNRQLLALLFVLNGYFYNLKTPQGMLVISAGHYKETKWRSSIQAVIVIIFGLLLTPLFGLVGILISSCLSNIYRDIDLLFYIPKKITHLPVLSTFKRWLLSFLEIFLIFIPFKFYDIKIVGIFSWIEYAFIYIIYSALVVLLVSYIFDRKSLKCTIIRIKLVLYQGKK